METNSNEKEILLKIKYIDVNAKKLVLDMYANRKYFTFVSVRSLKYATAFKDQFAVIKRISQQKKAYHELIDAIASFENLNVREELLTSVQTKLYSISHGLILPALEFGYSSEALELVNIMINPKIVGKLSELDHSEYLKEIIAGYGKRYVYEKEDYLKTTNHNLINNILVGRYGDYRSISADEWTQSFTSGVQRAINVDCSKPRGLG